MLSGRKKFSGSTGNRVEQGYRWSRGVGGVGAGIIEPFSEPLPLITGSYILRSKRTCVGEWRTCANEWRTCMGEWRTCVSEWRTCVSEWMT